MCSSSGGLGSAGLRSGVGPKRCRPPFGRRDGDPVRRSVDALPWSHQPLLSNTAERVSRKYVVVALQEIGEVSDQHRGGRGDLPRSDLQPCRHRAG